MRGHRHRPERKSDGVAQAGRHQHQRLRLQPATIEVVKGTTITWTNEDTVNHTVTTGTPPPTPVPTASPAGGASPSPTASRTPGPSPSLTKGDGKVDSGRIDATKTFSFTFNELGTFTYFCGVHPRMVATITVK